MRNILKSLILTSAIIFSPAVMAQTVAITGGKVIIGDGRAPIEGGTVVMRDGVIVAAGQNITVPADAAVIDASGKWVTPGIFAGFSRIGLVEISAVQQTNDSSANRSMFSAGLDVATSIDPFRSPIAVNRASGVTRAVVAPSSGGSLFAGQGAIADLGDDINPVTKAQAFQFAEMGERGSAIAGGSRSAAHILFKASLQEAQRYAVGNDTFDDNLLTIQDAKALLPVINGTTRLLVHVEGANDILRVLDLKREFPKLQLVLVGASEGWRVADKIAAANVPVIASAVNDLPSGFETLAATQSNYGRMKRAGVELAIGMIDDRDAHQLRYTPQYAGNLVSLNKVPRATGISWDEAFAAISYMPAKIMGMDATLGSLQSGRNADVVIWDGDPLELSTGVEAVYIDGKKQSLSNRQERLRERYRNPVEGALPKAYDR